MHVSSIQLTFLRILLVIGVSAHNKAASTLVDGRLLHVEFKKDLKDISWNRLIFTKRTTIFLQAAVEYRNTVGITVEKQNGFSY